jgi:signal transduction histidine kinase
MKTNFCLLILHQFSSATVPFRSDEKMMGVMAMDLIMENSELQTQLEEQLMLLEEMNVRLLKAERLAAWSKEASRLMAHEMRNSLVAIGGFAQRLYKNIPAGDERKEEAAIIVKEVERLEIMLQSLLNSGKLRPPELEKGNINEIIEEMLLFMHYELEKNNIKYSADLNPFLPEVMAEEHQIKQVLLNLIQNAMQAMEGGGELFLQTSIDGEFVQVSISDTGVGIPEDSIKNIFEPHFTTKKNGMGMGLAISREIIEYHNGNISVESQLGMGTTFTISLPTM